VTKLNRPATGRRRRSEGFALVLAILSLLLLTVLGLTLAATTTTEVQIATNYKWSQQAQNNAEAGIEIAKRVLRDLDWPTVLPAARSASWSAGSPPAPPGVPFSGAYRNFENAGCDTTGGIGYGVVLNNGTLRFENVTSIPGSFVPATVSGIDTRIIGAFTLWIRRPVVNNADGTFSDYAVDDNSMILTAEGTAPYAPPNTTSSTSSFMAVNRAVRVMEARLSRVPREPCGSRSGQQGVSQSGANFAACLTMDNMGAIAATGGLTGGGSGQGGGGYGVSGGAGGGSGQGITGNPW
jgi:hypothetical protein